MSVAKVSRGAGTILPMASAKSLPADEQERVRALLRAIVDQHGGVVLHASKSLGVSHSLVHEVLSGGRGAGTKLLRALSEHTGRSIDDILRGIERDAAPREGDALGDHPDYRAREAELQHRIERRGAKPDPVILAEMRTWSGSRALPKLSVEFLLRVYEALQQAHEDNWDDPEMDS